MNCPECETRMKCVDSRITEEKTRHRRFNCPGEDCFTIAYSEEKIFHHVKARKRKNTSKHFPNT